MHMKQEKISLEQLNEKNKYYWFNLGQVQAELKKTNPIETWV